ncbi:hypothetical protein ACET3X_006968 [Alternaria dauci]|uniref:Uncharacterized protein n=1 Tax=Alternaria dauci TaxID=48095 RepID=A0ABR3UG35_9PLEO
MSPRKTAAGDKIPKAKKAFTVKTRDNKVVKRPARGYHKFRNGLLNVAPKGDEKELTKQNRASPLLQLPPEIRNAIWKLVLGGKVYMTELAEFYPPWTKSKNAMALLRTCRQVYAEAASMPLTLTTFTTVCLPEVIGGLMTLKPHQRRMITSFHMQLRSPAFIQPLFRFLLKYGRRLAKLLPCLQGIHVQIFEVSDTSTQEANEERVRRYLELDFQDSLITIKVEQTDKKWIDVGGS